VCGQKAAGFKNGQNQRIVGFLRLATKLDSLHGLLAVGITELDNAEGYRHILSDLMREKNPVGVIETFLVESAAIEMSASLGN